MPPTRRTAYVTALPVRHNADKVQCHQMEQGSRRRLAEMQTKANTSKVKWTWPALPILQLLRVLPQMRQQGTLGRRGITLNLPANIMADKESRAEGGSLDMQAGSAGAGDPAHYHQGSALRGRLKSVMTHTHTYACSGRPAICRKPLLSQRVC